MSATYDPNLETLRDWVRLLIGDREVESGPRLQDAEIDAVLADSANKYIAAARCCALIIAQGRGAVSKSVGNLSISYGDSPESAYRAHAQKLQETGAMELLRTTGSHVLRML